MDRVLATMAEGIVGHGRARRPNLTFVNLHQIDSAGHATTPGGSTTPRSASPIDEIQRLVEALKARGEWERTVLILVSDHSMDATPNKLVLTDVLADAGIAESEFLAVDNGSIDLIYLANREAAAAGTSCSRACAPRSSPPTGSPRRSIASPTRPTAATPTRSAPCTAPGTPPASGPATCSSSRNPATRSASRARARTRCPATTGRPHTADNFLAITGGGDLVRTRTVAGGGRRANPVNVDIAPTVMGLLGLFGPDDSRGRFLADAFDRAELRKLSRPHRPRIEVKRSGLRFEPGGGRYDVAAFVDRRWQRVATSRARPFLGLAALPGEATRVRVRALSAASIKSGWRSIRVPD